MTNRLPHSTYMKTFSGILLLLFCGSQLHAQRSCGSVEYTKQLIRENPALQNTINQAEQQIINTLAKSRQYAARDTTANEIIHVPVVVHVLYNTAAQNISTAQILSQLTALNKDFASLNDDKVNTPPAFKVFAADTRIRFCLAQVDPQGRRTDGVIRKYTSAESFTADDAMKSSMRGGDDTWDCKRYLNIWVCSLGGRSLGYATPPGGSIDKDGVVIAFDVFGTVGNVRSPFNKGRTATHEIGHWLGLKHLWGDTDCGDDEVDDTPEQKSYNFGCLSFPHVTTCSPDGNGDMFMNYMDFSDDACMNMFTTGQKKRMRALFATGNLRNSFLTSFACDSALVQAGPTTPEPAPVAEAVDIFKVYPNPVQSGVTIEYKPAAEMRTKPIHIYNAIGETVFAGELNKEKNTFNFLFLSPGIYFIRIGEGKGGYSAKILKQ
jgi:Pregnancy-associated plasma protein-A/Secretion system C-terminal sorting domain